MQVFLKYDILKEHYQKTLKKLTLFFHLNPVPFNWQSYQKQKGPRTSEQLLFGFQNKFREIPLLIIYYLTKFDDVIQSSFWVTPKITSANFSKPIHDIINYSTSVCTFESRKCGKGKNYKNLNIATRTKRAFSMKYIFFFSKTL